LGDKETSNQPGPVEELVQIKSRLGNPKTEDDSQITQSKDHAVQYKSVSGTRKNKGKVYGRHKAPKIFSGASSSDTSRPLLGVRAIYPGNQEGVHFVGLEPAVSPESDPIAMEQTQVGPTANRMRVCIETMGNLSHYHQTGTVVRIVICPQVDPYCRTYH
jgi:hypothetical protein